MGILMYDIHPLLFYEVRTQCIRAINRSLIRPFLPTALFDIDFQLDLVDSTPSSTYSQLEISGLVIFSRGDRGP